MEFVNVAGTATIIHQTKPLRNSFPLPLTKLLTSLPSNSATYTLNSVLKTRNTLWLIKSLNSLLLAPGMTILSKRIKFLKNSLFISIFFRDVASPAPLLVPCFRSAALRAAAAFCSEIADVIRCSRATKSVR